MSTVCGTNRGADGLLQAPQQALEVRGTLHCWFPELGRIEVPAERRAVWMTAYKSVLKSPAYWLIACGTHAGVQVAFNVLVSCYARSHGWYGPVTAYALPALYATLATILIVWLVRRRITLNLREELNRRGRRTCVPCGYNLTGNVSGRFPECGRPTKDLP